jgi:hypothetical protein
MHCKTAGKGERFVLTARSASSVPQVKQEQLHAFSASFAVQSAL